MGTGEMKAAYEALGAEEHKRNNGRCHWWNNEVEEMIKEKKKLYNIWLTTQEQEDRNRYKEKAREDKKKVIKIKNIAWEERKERKKEGGTVCKRNKIATSYGA
jgi:hypothetical protein